MIWIKICGITTPGDAVQAIDSGASAIGLIFAPSRREVSIERAREIASVVRGRAELVGVFKETATIRAVYEAVRLDRIQIHGSGAPGIPVPVIRALRPQDIGRVHNPAEGEMTLIDGSEGRGQAFDWSLALGTPRPFVLAGGLTPENVGEAIRITRPYGVDVASGVEAEPGRKDPEKVRRFCAAVKEVDDAR